MRMRSYLKGREIRNVDCPSYTCAFCVCEQRRLSLLDNAITIPNSHVLTELFSRDVSFLVKATYAVFNPLSTGYLFHALPSANFVNIHFSKNN